MTCFAELAADEQHTSGVVHERGELGSRCCGCCSRHGGLVETGESVEGCRVFGVVVGADDSDWGAFSPEWDVQVIGWRQLTIANESSHSTTTSLGLSDLSNCQASRIVHF